MHMYTHLHMYTHTHTHMYTVLHTHMYIYSATHTRTHTHTHSLYNAFKLFIDKYLASTGAHDTAIKEVPVSPFLIWPSIV